MEEPPDILPRRRLSTRFPCTVCSSSGRSASVLPSTIFFVSSLRKREAAAQGTDRLESSGRSSSPQLLSATPLCGQRIGGYLRSSAGALSGSFYIF